MRDEHDGQPFAAQPAHHLEERRALLLVEAGGGFIEDEQLRLHIERTGNGDHLLEGDGTGAKLARHVELQAQPLQRAGRLEPHGAPLDYANFFRLSPEHDVLRDGESGDEVDFLIHCGDAMRLGFFRRLRRNLPTLEFNRAAVPLMHAREHLDEGGLARAVLAHERMNLTGAKREPDIFQCLHAAEGFADVPHLEENRTHDNTLAPPAGREEKIAGSRPVCFR